MLRAGGPRKKTGGESRSNLRIVTPRSSSPASRPRRRQDSVVVSCPHPYVEDPVGDSLFYREVPLPFLEAVQDPSRIRWRYGTIDLEEGRRIVLQNLPVCGNCHSFADNGSVLGLDVDYGNDKARTASCRVARTC